MRRAKPRTKSNPGIGIKRQPVMHVHRPQLKGQPVAQRQQRVQQNHRIESARECQNQPGVRGKVPCQHVRHPGYDGIILLLQQGLP